MYVSLLSTVSHNRGKSWNILPVDIWALLYFINFLSRLRHICDTTSDCAMTIGVTRFPGAWDN
jgi:hypothetical protein